MFCSQCEAPLEPSVQFCANCGLQARKETSSIDTLAIIQSTTAVPAPIVDPAKLGTKWLVFWNDLALPVGGILGLLMSFGTPPLGITRIAIYKLGIIAISILNLVVAYGLWRRKLWAWQWNWNLIFIAYANIVIKLSQPSPGCNRAILFFVALILGGLCWMWPNYVYWKKRRVLFSPR